MSIDAPATRHDVFIGWSGNTCGRRIATALHEFFENLHFKVFCSTANMREGDTWFSTVETALQASEFGVFVFTQANRYEPWLYYETATLRARGKPTCPITFGTLRPGDLPSPLNQLHGIAFSEEAVRELVERVGSHTHNPVKRKQFDAFWTETAADIAQALSAGQVDAARVRHASECITLPPSLAFYYERWRQVHNDPAHDFFLPSFSGVRLVDGPIHQARPSDDLETMYHLWADSECEGEIAVHLRTKPAVHHRVRFQNGRTTHLANAAFRPGGRRQLCTPDGRPFGPVSFTARVPAVAPDQADEVVLGVRVVDRWRTHWKLCPRSDTSYYLFAVGRAADDGPATGTRRIAIDLPTAVAHEPGGPVACEWVPFDSDGNPLYRAPQPDFSAILGIVIEFARGYGGSRVNGGGVVEVADFAVAQQPPAEVK